MRSVLITGGRQIAESARVWVRRQDGGGPDVYGHEHALPEGVPELTRGQRVTLTLLTSIPEKGPPGCRRLAD